MKISPSILTCDFVNLGSEIDSVIDHVDYLHIDVMDGVFVNNISFGIPILHSIRNKYPNAILDVHLMIIDPIRYIEKFASCGSNIITFHYEANSDIDLTILKIKEYGKKVGISIKPNTSVDLLIPYLDKVDLVLVMSVEPGFGGQKFNLEAVEKIKRLSELRTKFNYRYEIEVDGGINSDTVKLLKNSGCDVVVAGSYIFDSSNKVASINLLKK